MLSRVTMADTPLNSPWPLRYLDKAGRPFIVVLGSDDPQRWGALERMYCSFEPKECAQGLPPRTDQRRRSWLEGLLGQTLNVVAAVGGEAVGHAVLLDMEPGRTCEYLVFVHQDHQDRGIGTVLTRVVGRLAGDLGYGRVWLTVERTNPRAIHVYENAGFQMVGPADLEREMVLTLRQGA
jgi:RimJ/RimL family protein N-acetyltransferase